MFPNPYWRESSSPLTGQFDVFVTEQRDPLEWLVGQSQAMAGRALMNRTEEAQRRDYERLIEHMKKQAREHEIARLFSDQFIDDVAGQRVHTRFMLG